MRDSEKQNRGKRPDFCNNIYTSYKLNSYNWLEDIPVAGKSKNVIEVRFKNTRKEYYININELRLKTGNVVAVESSPGHDIGIISLTGELAYKQMVRNCGTKSTDELKKVYRKAKAADLEKWKEARSLERSTMLKSRKIAEDLGLKMKIGDVEYQGDNTKAVFYYIADGRVDFRELIKILADEFKVRIEMRQIGARQETGRIGGTGPCGRELCCSSWIKDFVSVTTNCARYQELSLNPQKLAGQCGKLKCCLNYELDSYLDAKKDFPDTSIPLKTDEGTAYHQKTDIYRKLMWYSIDKDNISELTVLSVERVNQIQKKNKNGEKVPFLLDKGNHNENMEDFKSNDGEENIDRFSKHQKKRKKRRKKNNQKKKIRK